MPAQFGTKTLAAVEVNDATKLYPIADPLYGREEQVYATLGNTALVAIQAALPVLPVPDSIIIGRYKQADYDRFKENATYGISLWPLPMSGPKNRWISSAQWSSRPTSAIPLIATVTGQQIAFTGTSIGGLNVAALVGRPLQTVVISTVDADTPTTIATKLATAISTLAPITALSSANVVNVVGAVIDAVRIGGKAVLQREVERIEQSVQISVWAGVRALRSQVGDALRSAIGTTTSAFLSLGDGTSMWMKYASHRWMDDDQIDSLWVYHLIVTAEYPTMQTQPAWTVVAPQAVVTANTLAPVTLDG